MVQKKKSSKGKNNVKATTKKIEEERKEIEETKEMPKVTEDLPDDDEEDDEDFDPNAKVEDEVLSDSDNEAVPDYHAIEAATSQVRTRNQRYNDTLTEKSVDGGLVKVTTTLDIDGLFADLKKGKGKDDWKEVVEPSNAIKAPVPVQAQAPALITADELAPQLITIKSSYTFAGKVFTETKEVDANSAEAQAYLNSTICLTEETEVKKRSFIPVLRKLPNSEETVELRIKLKRPSLIDKFLNGSKKQKLSTLEKSRLDWAGFVDKRKIKDELKIGNKGGYLDKQDFLGRVQAKRDDNFQEAKERERLNKKD